MINIKTIKEGDCVSFINKIGIYAKEDENLPENIVGTITNVDVNKKEVEITIMNDVCFTINDSYGFDSKEFKNIKRISIKQRDKILDKYPRKK